MLGRILNSAFIFSVLTAPIVLKAENTSCGPIIADSSTGTYFTGDKKNKFQCFKSTRSAKKKGYLTQAQINKLDFTGWYRLRLTRTVKNTCEAPGASGGAGVLFLQLRQSGSAVFGNFCPLFTEMGGTQDENEISITSTRDFGGESGIGSTASNPCPDGHFREISELVLSRVVAKGPAFTAEFKTTRRCLSDTYADRSCVEIDSGIAFHETHPIWPDVSSNVNELANGCTQALTTCKDCHSNIGDFPRN